MIFNVRFGFATNSSSTHSIIISKDKIRNDPPSDKYFGWENFTLVKTSSKRDYLAAILNQHLTHLIGEEMARDLVVVWCDIDKDSEIGSVDHQSVPTLPLNWNGRGLNRQFFKEYKKFILDESVIILGGNDNGTELHPKAKGNYPFTLPLIYDRKNTSLVARKDKANGYWTIFDREEGTKIRMAFSAYQTIPTKASAPELVDVKITDHCQRHCAFCYQGSSKEGAHADRHYIDRVIRTLAENEVFEVALGGGDPTSHPNFSEILRNCRWQGVVPNFTVADLDWLDDPVKRRDWLDFCGGIAYSVTSGYEVRRLGFALNKYQIPSNKFQIQIIEGVVNDYQFDQILEECHYHNLTLTILGFKDTGRGKSFSERLHSFDWIDKVRKVWRENRPVTVGVDTLIAEKYQDELINIGIDEIFFTTREGSFSCYIDAVRQQIGPSSYAPKQMTSFTDTDQFIQKFSTF